MLKNRSRVAMQAALLLGAVASLPAQPGALRTVPAPPRRRLPTAIDSAASELQREIAEWNAAIEKRKAEKRRLRGA